jgi:hypothetical protein
MKRSSVLSITVLIAVTLHCAVAQSEPKATAKDSSGFTSYVAFGGTSNSQGQIYELSTSVGYDFNRHFSADLGVPFYFIRPSSSITVTSANGVGDPFLGVRLKVPNPIVNFDSVLTGFVPAGDSKKGLGTGRGTFDWTNHFDHSFSGLKPFADAGIANTIVSTQMFVRPYTTLGFNTHFQGGATYEIYRFFTLGASAYDILPAGPQTVFSRVAHGAAPQHGRVFEANQQTTGGADIARDNGFSTWLEASPGRVVDIEIGFTRSMHYDLNSISVMVGLNLKQLYGRRVQ